MSIRVALTGSLISITLQTELYVNQRGGSSEGLEVHVTGMFSSLGSTAPSDVASWGPKLLQEDLWDYMAWIALAWYAIVGSSCGYGLTFGESVLQSHAWFSS